MKYNKAERVMFCPRCKTPMKEKKRTFHKKRKWVCPNCGKVVMQTLKKSKIEKLKKAKD